MRDRGIFKFRQIGSSNHSPYNLYGLCFIQQHNVTLLHLQSLSVCSGVTSSPVTKIKKNKTVLL